MCSKNLANGTFPIQTTSPVPGWSAPGQDSKLDSRIRQMFANISSRRSQDNRTVQELMINRSLKLQN
jgi:hypothetical protein